MKVIFFVFVLITVACENGKSTRQRAPDAVRDLLIDRIVWKPRPIPNRPGVQLNQHQFSLTNTSGEHTYHHIRVRFDYYDSQYHRINSTSCGIDQVVAPRSAVAVPLLQAGITHPLAKSATVRIEKAMSD